MVSDPPAINRERGFWRTALLLDTFPGEDQKERTPKGGLATGNSPPFRSGMRKVRLEIVGKILPQPTPPTISLNDRSDVQEKVMRM